MTRKEFIEAHKDNIENNNFQAIYDDFIADPDVDFDLTSLTEVFLKAGLDPLADLRYIPEDFYTKRTLKQLIIKASVEVEERAFELDDIDYLQIDRKADIGEYAFRECFIRKLVISPDADIDYNAFYRARIAEIIIDTPQTWDQFTNYSKEQYLEDIGLDGYIQSGLIIHTQGDIDESK